MNSNAWISGVCYEEEEFFMIVNKSENYISKSFPNIRKFNTLKHVVTQFIDGFLCSYIKLAPLFPS